MTLCYNTVELARELTGNVGYLQSTWLTLKYYAALRLLTLLSFLEVIRIMTWCQRYCQELDFNLNGGIFL